MIWIKARPESVFPEPGSNREYLRDALRRARVTNQDGSPRDALVMAADMLRSQEGAREICLLSDFQKTAFGPDAWSVPPGIEFIPIPVSRSDAANTALTRLYFHPAAPLPGEEVEICGEVQNFSDQAVSKKVFLHLENSAQSRDILLPPWQKGLAVFHIRLPRPGLYPVSLSLNEDLFSPDNQRRGVLEVRESIRIGLLDAEPQTAAAWKRVLAATGWASVEPLTRDALAEKTSADILLMAGWDGTPAESIRAFLRRGGAVIWYPARNMPFSRITELAGIAPQPDAGPLLWQEEKNPLALRVTAEDDPVFRIFSGGEYGNPARASFRARFRLPPTLPAGSTALLSYADDIPALVRIPANGGSLFIWNLPLNKEAGNLADLPEFVLLFAELVLAGRPAAAAWSAAADCLPGQALQWTPPHGASAADVALVSESGHIVPTSPLATDQGAGLSSATLDDPGLYTWRRDQETLGYGVVNFKPAESDLRILKPAEIEQKSSAAIVTAAHTRILHEGIRLWPFLLAAAGLVALAEIAAARWAART